MKVGVPGFSYAGFEHFADSINDFGYYTSNLGDNAQTIAGKHAWRAIGIDDEDIIVVDRDTLPAYDGPPVALLMNAVFHLHNLPAPSSVTPIFLGFCAEAGVVRAHANWLRAHMPIGCRDMKTAEHCQACGIDAFVTGCVTLSLPPRTSQPAQGRLFVVFGWAGLLPSAVLRHVPSYLLDTAEFVHHRHVEGSLPLIEDQRILNEAYELHLLQRYREEASLVLTPLLHVASPCVAMQVPVVLCRRDRDSRFSLMEKIMPLYTTDQVHEIDWDPSVPNVSSIARSYIECLRRWRT